MKIALVTIVPGTFAYSVKGIVVPPCFKSFWVNMFLVFLGKAFLRLHISKADIKQKNKETATNAI